ncbi:cold-shock protein [Marinobacter salicampi]|uniref:cold-shock protein n=1 Tax=Marinobacter salicampi TaxID=435907 RepID=UPI00140A0196|nr:cold shock domain-containing protein [Marinobacter salicampi]
MRNPGRVILLAVLIAIPAPFILGFLLAILTPEVFQILSQTGSSELAGRPTFILGSAQGIAAYLLTLVVFAAACFLTVALSPRQTVSAANPQAVAREPRPQPRNQPEPQHHDQYDDEEEDDYDESTPEGDEEGTVKWFNVKKGFGFIVRESGDEIFVHFRAIRGRGRRVLRQGQLVRFNVVEADKGLQADNVSILSD